LSIAAADFDGDGKPDLALALWGAASVLLGNGDGSFQASKLFAVTSTPYAIVAGDFDGDGKADVAIANDTTSVLDRRALNLRDHAHAPRASHAYEEAPTPTKKLPRLRRSSHAYEEAPTRAKNHVRFRPGSGEERSRLRDP
jgi:hypothetical protein